MLMVLFNHHQGYADFVLRDWIGGINVDSEVTRN
jgi:hypothetical protein